jgi:alanine racemase
MSGSEKTNKYKTWVEISKKALLHNVNVIKESLKTSPKFCAVIKSNAYGHGLGIVSGIIKDEVDYFAVDDIDEAVDLRLSGINKPILIFGFVPHARYAELLEYDLEVTISTFEDLAAAENAGPVKIHVMVETGLGRQGFLQGIRMELLDRLEKSSLEVVGLYSHLSSAESPLLIQKSYDQLAQFSLWQVMFQDKGFRPLCHISASSAFILSSDFELDMVRVGINLYGLWGSDETQKRASYELEPAMTWKAVVAEVKDLPAGHSVGYDRTHILKRDSKIAVVPVGYWHGYDRGLSDKALVYVNDCKVSVLGRVSMNMITVDVTDCPNTSVSDEVILLGGPISASDFDSWAETINYEVVARILTTIPRIAC